MKDHRDYTSIDLHTSSRPDIETIGNLEANLRVQSRFLTWDVVVCVIYYYRMQKAEAQQQVLEQKLDAARSLLEQLSSENSRSKATSVHLPYTETIKCLWLILRLYLDLAAAAVYTEKFSEISQVASDLTVALGHCVGLVAVQEEVTSP